jgi:hypothetical protein
MAVKVATSELMLDALLENPNVKAAVLVDDRGYIVDRRGSAASLKAIGDERDTEVASPDARPSENLYIVHVGEEYLIVVFNDRLSFERIKKSVDETLAEFDVLPEDGE